MPTSILVSEFIHETNDDYNSPITSSFGTRISECKSMIANHEEVLDFDRDGLTKMKKAIKAILTSGTTHFENEMYLATALEKIGDNACAKDPEVDIGAAFIKFAVVTKELSALMKTLMQNLNNIVMFPLDNLLKGDLRGVKGDLKRPFDKASKDYDSKFFKIEKEKKQQSKEAGFIRSEVQGSEIAEEMEKERRMFQLQMCEYLIKFNEIKTKKGIDLLQNLVEYYHAQTNYFQDGLKTIEYFGNYVAALSVKLQKIRQNQDEERRQLSELRTLLVRSTPGLDKDLTNTGSVPGGGTTTGAMDSRTAAGYSLHQLQGDKHHGVTRAGHLLKKSDGKMRRVWQKRRCRVQAEGYLEICHADESKPPTRLNLLTCQIKPVLDDRKGFDLLSYNRTYHFQAEDEQDAHAWMSVLVNCKEMALKKAFDDSGKRQGGGAGGGSNSHSVNHSLIELQQSIIRHIQRIPGNDHCCDCNSQNDATWLSTNFGIIVCIECSGVHRDLGVHISRIQSLVLDNVGTSQLLLARYMTNQQFNDIMEAKLPHGNKPTPSDSMEIRFNFIRAKYVDKKYAQKTCHSEQEKLYDLEVAISNSDLGQLLQTFAENVDLSANLPSSECNETALHRAVLRSNSKNLYIVDFLVQNMSPHGIDRQTAPAATATTNNVASGCNTALHLCAIYDKVECMKLLLRSGADTNIRNSQDKTPLDIAHDMEFHTIVELLQNAAVRQKSLFDNINTDWNLLHDDGSTDFSDDETIVDDRNGSLTPEKKNRSRPPSYSGGDSPVTIRSRSSTCDSLQSGNVGSLKKRAAPLPPCGGSTIAASTGVPAHNNMYGTLPIGHSRTPSDSVGGGLGVGLGVPLPGAYHTLSHPVTGGHKRSPSGGDQQRETGVPTNCPRSVINVGKQVIPFDAKLAEKLAHIRRPQNPPPPAPPAPQVPSGTTSISNRLSNGRSIESISSMLSDLDMGCTGSNADLHHIQPIPPPRRDNSPPPPLNSRQTSTSTFKPPPLSIVAMQGAAVPGPQVPAYYQQQVQQQQTASLRRCTALYDCDADNDDELSFKEGDVIVVTNEHTDDDNWMEGYLEARPECSGMFPIMFVHMNNGNGGNAGTGAGSSIGSGD